MLGIGVGIDISKLGILFQGNPLLSILGNFDFWSDNTIESGQLIDKSGNARHATVDSNLISNANAVLGSTFKYLSNTAPTINTSLNTSPPVGFSGQYYSRIRWESVPTAGFVCTESFILLSNESGFIEFWAKKVTNTSIFFALQPGNGGSVIVPSNLSAATYLVEGSQAVGQWGRYRVPFTNVNPGGLAFFRLQVLSGTHEVEIFFPPSYDSGGQMYGGVTLTGQSNVAFRMPDVAALKSADTLNHFYTSSGIPLNIRANNTYNAYTNRIYCGGAFRYVFLKADPDYTTDTTLAYNFENLDFAFDSCPVELEVGAGKTYANQRAAELAPHNGTHLNRRRIKLFEDQVADTYSDYQYVGNTVGPNTYMVFLQSSKNYTYWDGVSTGARIQIIGSKEVSATDTQLRYTELAYITNNGGFRNIDFKKINGGYFLHRDFIAMENSQHIMLNCSLQDFGLVGVLEYRSANALPPPALEMTWSAIAGGGHPKFRDVMRKVTLNSNYALSWQNASCDTDGFDAFYREVTMTATNLYDPVLNPDLTAARAIRFISSNVQPCYLFFSKSTRNTDILKTGSPETLISTGI